MFKIIMPIFLIAGLIIAVYLVVQETHLFSKAAPDYTPQDVKITNLSDNGFTVTWVTTTLAKGFINFGTQESLGGNVLDDRDEVEPKARQTHHISLKNLEPDTTYYFKIGSGPSIFGDQGQLFQQKTAPTTQDIPPLADPLFGKITKSDQSVPKEALIYLTSPNGTLLSSFTRDEGNWLITLDNARTKDLARYLTFKDGDSVTINIEAVIEGSLKKDVILGQRDQALELILEAPGSRFTVPSEVKLQDFNGDGIINIFDYLLLRLRSLI